MTASNGNEYEDDDIQHQHQMLVERKKDISIVECKDRVGFVFNVDADDVVVGQNDIMLLMMRMIQMLLSATMMMMMMTRPEPVQIQQSIVMQ